MQASAGARSALAALLHRYEKAEDELAPLLATSISKLRRLRDLAFYMGYRADRWEGRVTPGLRVRRGKMGSAPTDRPGVLLSSRGASERMIALRPRDGASSRGR